MGGTECFIGVETVKEKIPLLLSKQSLRNDQTVIDIGNDKVNVFDKKVDLYFSPSGHYCLSIFPEESKNKYEEILVLENDLNAVENHSQILKIYISSLDMQLLLK